MKLNARTEYACLAMLQLADDQLSGLAEPSRVKSLSERQGIPEGFLVQILQSLRRSGLVTSTRGANGGYRLARPAEAVSLADVIDAIEGGGAASYECGGPLAEALHGACDAMREAQRRKLADVSLADLIEQTAAPTEPMWYI